MAPNGTLSMRRQCALLAVTRSSVYYEPVVPDAEELALMRRIDELHLQHPFFGSRMITQTLKAEGPVINRKRVQRLMRLMGLESTAPQPTEVDPILWTGFRVLLQGLGSRARIRWVDLVTRPIRTPCGSAASARPRRPSPSIAPVPCGAHA